jgi:hypothetical protein
MASRRRRGRKKNTRKNLHRRGGMNALKELERKLGNITIEESNVAREKKQEQKQKKEVKEHMSAMLKQANKNKLIKEELKEKEEKEQDRRQFEDDFKIKYDVWKEINNRKSTSAMERRRDILDNSKLLTELMEKLYLRLKFHPENAKLEANIQVNKCINENIDNSIGINVSCIKKLDSIFRVIIDEVEERNAMEASELLAELGMGIKKRKTKKSRKKRKKRKGKTRKH